MRNIIRSRLMKLCCYVLAASITLPQVLHASFMANMNEPTNHAMSETVSGETTMAEKPCHQHIKDRTHDQNTGMDSHSNHSNSSNSLAVDCDKDGNFACKILCTVSITAIPNVSSTNLIVENTNNWNEFNTENYTPSISLPLFKPPRF